MDLKKEREAFLNVYVNYKGDSRKIQFNEETEQFMWRKNNVSDTEVEYVHVMNQRWYAWLACAKSKAQAVPDGFVVVPKEPTDEILKVANKILIAAYELRISNNQCLKRIYQAMIEAQEPTND